MSGRLVSSGLIVIAAGMTIAAQPPAAPPAQPGQGTVPAGHPQIPLPKVGADWPKARPEDVTTIDAIMKAFYEVPAGQPGEARDWDRYRSLFVPDARLVAARPGEAGTSGTFYLLVTDYIEANKKYFEKGGFRDTEAGRRVEAFGNIAHVWSTYESRHKAEDPQPYTRGINSIQLLKDSNRYWIVNVFWDYERPENPVPEKYLQTPKE
ncbi:MAG: hypothetical protein IT436_04785 [Phycisphaerales bacterium]|nr:hypothetical protein [Phycisphaerales bacterium]